MRFDGETLQSLHLSGYGVSCYLLYGNFLSPDVCSVMVIYGAYYFGQFKNLNHALNLQKQIEELVP